MSVYDDVAYPGFAYPDTHPDRLAVMAVLHGLSPAPVEHCRVLEVACGEGANLIPMAYAIPGSEFVGFDLAGQPIERGQTRIRELGPQEYSAISGKSARCRPGAGQLRIHHRARVLLMGSGTGARPLAGDVP